MDGDPARISRDDLEPVQVQTIAGRTERELTDAYEQHHDAIYGFLRRATRDPDTAEDLLQETFTRLFASYRAGRRPEDLQAWLYRVA